ncbi:MAG: sulfatase [Planctomycetaceae bacterium]
MLRKTGSLFLLVLSLATSAAAADNVARPNILFCIADDLSYPHLGAYGCSWVKSPGFDRVAREGLLFRRAYTPNAKCAPSRACILTGRNSWQLEEACNHWCDFPSKFKSYVEVLGKNGYFTGSTAKGWAPGVARDDAGRPRQLAGPTFNTRKSKPPAQGISNNDYAGNFGDFLDAAPATTPWCFWYGCTEPHRGYEFGSGVAKGGKQLADVDHVPAFYPDNDVIRNDLLDYAYEVEWFDQHLVRMLDELVRRDQVDNTLVVVTADNGMPFPRIKGQEYELSNHLPLAMMWPHGIKQPGRTVEDYVSFIDFAPTFIEVAGLDWEQTGLSPTPGRSLTDIFAGQEPDPPRDHVLIGKERHDIGRPHDQGYPIRGIVQNGMLYLENFETDRWPAGNPETGYLNCDGSPTKTELLNLRGNDEQKRYWTWSFGKRGAEELYNISTDPECMRNLAIEPQYAAEKTQLKDRMTTELKAQEDPRMFGQGAVFDEYRYAEEKSRGFYERVMQGEKLKAGWINPTDVQPAVDR